MSLIVGTGAVGAIYSWRLAQACNVTTVCRSNFEAVRQHGFNIDSKKFGQETFIPHQGMYFSPTVIALRILTSFVPATSCPPSP